MMKGQQGPSQIFLLKTKDSHKLNVQPALENFQIKLDEVSVLLQTSRIITKTSKSKR